MQKQKARRKVTPIVLPAPSRLQEDGQPYSLDNLLRLPRSRRYLLALQLKAFHSEEDEQSFLCVTPEEQCAWLLSVLHPIPPPDEADALRQRARELEGQVAALIDTVHVLATQQRATSAGVHSPVDSGDYKSRALLRKYPDPPVVIRPTTRPSPYEKKP